MTRLAEAYFHLKPFEVSDELLQRLGQDVSSIAADAALGLFDPSCEIEIRLESGSLKGKALVIGALVLGTYHAVAEYKDFKEGVAEIVASARTYGGGVIEGVLKEEEVPPKSVYRTERRTRTPGKLLRVLKRREWLAAHRSVLSAADVERETAAVEALTSQVLDDLSPDERVFVGKLLKAADAPLESVKRLEGLQRAPPRAHLDDGRAQPELFDFTPDIRGAGGLLPANLALPTPDENYEGEFYARFKLSDWRAQHPDHFPREPHERPSSAPDGISPTRRDRKPGPE